MTARSKLLVPALRELGIGALYQYARYNLALRTSQVRRSAPASRWDDHPLESVLSSGFTLERILDSRESLFFDDGSLVREKLQSFPSDDLIQEAGEILTGAFRLFGADPVSLGDPPNWGHVPLSNSKHTIEPDRHWTEYTGDIDLRLLWEPSRLGWAFALCRAFWFTGDRRYVDGFFHLWSSWMASNQPNLGPHWISGQECGLRMLVLLFVWHSLLEEIDSSGDRERGILLALAVHAARIPPTLGYARAQRNNHLITEAVALYSVGLVMPWFERSAEWKQMGRRWLISALEDQVFEDGGYIQYSTNYHRLALSLGLWAARLAEIHERPLPEATLDALRRMTEFLLALVDPRAGTVPNWGHNDGSNALPLASCAHNDYRPVLQAASRAILGGPAFEPGPWDEMSLWLGLPVTGQPSESDRVAAEFPKTGLYIARGESTKAALRCARFTARPAHSDQLHLDLWWKEHNIVRDPGTFRYTADPPWDNTLAGAKAHNGLVVDGREPMDRAGRFLWLNWSKARFLGRWQAADGSVQALAAEHSMRDGLTHRRSVVQAGSALWVVLDELLGPRSSKGFKHHVRLAWGLIDWPWELDGQRLTLSGDPGSFQLRVTPNVDSLALYRAGQRLAGENQPFEDPAVLGWWSPTYATKDPALTLVAAVEGTLPIRLTTWWRLGEIEPQELIFETGSLEEDPLIAFLSGG